MKNQTILIAAVGAGIAIAGTLAYFFLTDDGKEQVKNKARDIASAAVSKKTGIAKRKVRKVAQHVG